MQDIVISEEDVWKGGFFRVKRQRIRGAQGKNYFRELVSRSDGVAIVPITKDGQVVMTQECSPGMGKMLLFVPGGMSDATSESRRQQDAQRELREETGMRANKLIKIWQTFEAPAVLDHKIHVYLGLDLVSDQLISPNPDEKNTILTMDLDEAIAKTSAPDGSSASVLAALYMARDYLSRYSASTNSSI